MLEQYGVSSKTMAGIGSLFSFALRGLLDSLEAGTGEAVRIEVGNIMKKEQRDEEQGWQAREIVRT